ncbi:unnamed protein product [Parascedosporium putredinis]|uniref:Uncharacterized protein n=1 Tax=Parascedosporium putredinis TaxID=1442378 RepID=A0A9P1ME47_9PEZI|nr:unnamed protein product [Parascedosporium putredinis]CAI8001939.1 unnamed protein product [Parascedosporium putredinis]
MVLSMLPTPPRLATTIIEVTSMQSLLRRGRVRSEEAKMTQNIPGFCFGFRAVSGREQGTRSIMPFRTSLTSGCPLPQDALRELGL